MNERKLCAKCHFIKSYIWKDSQRLFIRLFINIILLIDDDHLCSSPKLQKYSITFQSNLFFEKELMLYLRISSEMLFSMLFLLVWMDVFEPCFLNQQKIKLLHHICVTVFQIYEDDYPDSLFSWKNQVKFLKYFFFL